MMFTTMPPTVLELFTTLRPVELATFEVLPPTILTIGADLYGRLVESLLYPGLWS